MSILIKGLEMPKDCYTCPFMYHEPRQPEVWCTATDCDSIDFNLLDLRNVLCGERHKDCPLVPIPPHGRLIDADAIKKRISHMNMEAYMDGACYGIHPSLEYLYLLNEILDDAPTIIPAEEGET